MFFIAKQKDTVRVEPEDLEQDRAATIKKVINRKYANKILPNVGLCICLYDVLASSEGMILHSDGCFLHKVIFRLVVFRPFMGEVIEARVQSCSEAGFNLHVKFFDDIKVPHDKLLRNMAYDPRRARWFWNPQLDPDEILSALPETAPFDEKRALLNKHLFRTADDERFWIEIGEFVRVRVVEEHFHDTGPVKNPKMMNGAPPSGSETTESEIAPYAITCSMTEEGLGVLGWWREPAGDVAEEL